MDEGFRTKLLEAMKWEDDQLRNFVDTCQLDRWYETTLDVARKTVASAYDSQAMAKSANGNGNAKIKNGDAQEDGALF
jgi:nuclear pore complex protein Nup133